MTDKFADDPEVLPDSKKPIKLRIFTIIAFVVVIGMGVWEMTAGKLNTRKQTAEAGHNSTIEKGMASEKAGKAAMSNMVRANGDNDSAGNERAREMNRKLQMDTREARKEAEAKTAAEHNALPPTIDPATGLPVEGEGANGAVNGGKAADARKMVIPGAPEGWNPEQDIIIPQGQQTPAYRVQPAYLRGSSLPYDNATMAAWDKDWVESAHKPSFGKSVAITNTYSKVAGAVQVGHRGSGSSVSVKLASAGEADPVVNQRFLPTPLRRDKPVPVRVHVLSGGGAQ